MVTHQDSELSIGVHVDLGESGRLSSAPLVYLLRLPRGPLQTHPHGVFYGSVSAHVLLPQKHACLHAEQAKNAESSSPGRVLRQ